MAETIERAVNKGREKEREKEGATFVVKVNFRQNVTWQGTISWTDQKKTQHFRSALELIRLMDEALRQEDSMLPVMWERQDGQDFIETRDTTDG